MNLVFLHIPKTAGTSLRHKLNLSYGRNNVFWIGVDCDSTTTVYPNALVGDRPVMGGHRGISFYPEHFAPIYCSVVRDPVERAISLFAYYTRPDLAKTAGQIRERQKLLERMLKAGIDPDNIQRSVEHCLPFRSAISNHQCRFLSRSEATFNAVLATLKQHDFVIGTMSRYAYFYDHMCNLLSWQSTATATLNRSKDNYASEYLSDVPGLDMIRELNREDLKLVDYIEQRKDGLIDTINASVPDLRVHRLKARLLKRL